MKDNFVKKAFMVWGILAIILSIFLFLGDVIFGGEKENPCDNPVENEISCEEAKACQGSYGLTVDMYIAEKCSSENGKNP
jgi:hypothetical protein